MYGCGRSAVCVQYSQQTVVMAAHQRAGGAQVIPARVPLPAAAHTQMGTVLTAVTELKKPSKNKDSRLEISDPAVQTVPHRSSHRLF